MTIINANQVATQAQSDPLKFHYISFMSDQLTGDFTVPAAELK